MVTFELLVRPAIRKMLGQTLPYRRTVSVRANEAFRSATSRKDFVRAVVAMQDGELTASVTGAQGSGILASMAKANALLIVPGKVREVTAGETVRAILLESPDHVDEVPY
jgi:molybdopterin molybdotransferase